MYLQNTYYLYHTLQYGTVQYHTLEMWSIISSSPCCKKRTKASSYGDRVYLQKECPALSELKNVKNPTVMGTKYAWKKEEVVEVQYIVQ